jgi:hypothetical protein
VLDTTDMVRSPLPLCRILVLTISSCRIGPHNDLHPGACGTHPGRLLGIDRAPGTLPAGSLLHAYSVSAPIAATLASRAFTALTGGAYLMHTPTLLSHVPPTSTAARICAQVASPRVRVSTLVPPTSSRTPVHLAL